MRRNTLIAACASIALAIGSAMPAQAQLYCPPLITCFPKPFPVLDDLNLAQATAAIAQAGTILTAVQTMASLANSVKSVMGGKGAARLALTGISQVRSDFAPSFLQGVTGDYPSISAQIQSQYSMPAGASDATLASYKTQATQTYSAAVKDAYALAEIRKSQLQTSIDKHAAITADMQNTSSLRDDIEVNTKARLLVADQIGAFGELFATYVSLEAASANRTTAPNAQSLAFNSQDTSAAYSQAANTATLSTATTNLANAVQTHNDRATAQTLNETIANSNSITSNYQTLSDQELHIEQQITASLAPIYANPAAAWQAIKSSLIAEIPANPVNWSSLNSTLQSGDVPTYVSTGNAQITQSWSQTVAGVDQVYQAQQTNPSAFGPTVPLPSDASQQTLQFTSSTLNQMLQWAASYQNLAFYSTLLPNLQGNVKTLNTAMASLQAPYGGTSLTSSSAQSIEASDIAAAQAALNALPAGSVSASAISSYQSTITALQSDPQASTIVNFTPLTQ